VRIVSLLPSATEIVYALGLGDQLEGRTFECDYPPEVQQRPIVSSSGLPENVPLGEIDDAVRAATAGETPLYRLDEARIAQIQPDLILTQDLCRVCAVPSGDVDEALGRLGCRAEVVSLDPYSLDEVMIDIQNEGRAAGVDARADQLVDSLRARIAAVEASVSLASVDRFGADADPRRVLALEWVDPPWGAGHWIPDMVERAGGEPVLGYQGGHAEVTKWDAIREEAPTIVVVAPCGYHLAAAADQARAVLAELATTPAGWNNEVWAIDADASVAPRTPSRRRSRAARVDHRGGGGRPASPARGRAGQLIQRSGSVR
jgi:iron complex transport system substrate-binding protein